MFEQPRTQRRLSTLVSVLLSELYSDTEDGVEQSDWLIPDWRKVPTTLLTTSVWECCSRTVDNNLKLNSEKRWAAHCNNAISFKSGSTYLDIFVKNVIFGLTTLLPQACLGLIWTWINLNTFPWPRAGLLAFAIALSPTLIFDYCATAAVIMFQHTPCFKAVSGSSKTMDNKTLLSLKITKQNKRINNLLFKNNNPLSFAPSPKEIVFSSRKPVIVSQTFSVRLSKWVSLLHNKTDVSLQIG